MLSLHLPAVYDLAISWWKFINWQACENPIISWWPSSAGRATNVDRANRVCLACNSGAIGNEEHMIAKECTALTPLRQQHADLFRPRTDTMRSFFTQQDHLGVLNYIIGCLNFMNM